MPNSGLTDAQAREGAGAGVREGRGGRLYRRVPHASCTKRTGGSACRGMAHCLRGAFPLYPQAEFDYAPLYPRSDHCTCGLDISNGDGDGDATCQARDPATQRPTGPPSLLGEESRCGMSTSSFVALQAAVGCTATRRGAPAARPLCMAAGAIPVERSLRHVDHLLPGHSPVMRDPCH